MILFIYNLTAHWYSQRLIEWSRFIPGNKLVKFIILVCIVNQSFISKTTAVSGHQQSAQVVFRRRTGMHIYNTNILGMQRAIRFQMRISNFSTWNWRFAFKASVTYDFR